VCCLDATASPLVAKVQGEVFAHCHAVIKHHSSMWNWLFGLPGWILCEQSSGCQRKRWACSWFCSSAVSLFSVLMNWIFHVWLMLSSLNAYLIIARVSVALFPRFAQNFMLFLCRIHHEISSRQVHDSKWKDIKNYHVHPAACNLIHWLPRYASIIIYSCIMIIQLLYRWQHQYRKLWILAYG
jgi:hypothetical protein